MNENDDEMIFSDEISAIINVINFIEELKKSATNTNNFITKFHSLLNNKNENYQEILTNLIYADSIITEHKNNKDRNNNQLLYIDDFLKKGIIEIKSKNQEKNQEDKNEEIVFIEAIVQIENKKESFDIFMEKLKRIKPKIFFNE